MRASHRLSITGTACVVALVAASPLILSVGRDTAPESTAVTPAYDYGTVDATGVTASGLTGPKLSYPTYPGGGLTITPTVTNGGSSFTWGNWSTPAYSISLNATDWSGGNSTNAIYTPTAIFAQKGPAVYYKGAGVCSTTVSSGSIGSPTIATCPNAGGSSAPTVTFTFSQPVTNWSLSINDLGGFNGDPAVGGQTMYANWVVTSGQTLSLVSGNNNFQVTGGNTIKVNSPAATYANNATGAVGVGAGTVLVAGTYSSVTFRLDYFIANTDSVSFTTTPTDPPDAMSFQWSLSPAVTLTYDCNGGSGSPAGTAVPPGGSATVAGGSGCSRPGYTFAGWNTAAGGSGTPTAVGSSLTLSADTTLYAVWTPVPPAPPAPPAPSDSATPTPTSTPTPIPAPAPAGPFAVDDLLRTMVNTPVSGNAAANDTYPAGSVFTQASSPANGTVAWNSNGSYTYSPNPGFTGVDSFTYRVCMPAPNQARCASATERITVGEPEPKATPQSKKVSQGSTRPLLYAPVGLSRPASGSTLRPGSVAIAQWGSGRWGKQLVVPGKGTWVLKGTQVQFVPDRGFTGQTTIRYRIQDRNGKWAYSTLTASAPAIPTDITGGR